MFYKICSTVLIILLVSSCAPSLKKPTAFQIAIGSTKCSRGDLFRARAKYPNWVKIGTCSRGPKTGSIYK